LYSDGTVEGPFGQRLASRPKSGYTEAKAKEANFLIMDEDVWDYEELPQAIRTARKAVAQSSLRPHRYLRAKMAGKNVVRRGKATVELRTKNKDKEILSAIRQSLK